MKKFKLQTVLENGELVDESTLEVKEGSILIQHLPDTLTHEQRANMHNQLKKVLEEKRSLITIFPNTKLQVLNIIE